MELFVADKQMPSIVIVCHCIAGSLLVSIKILHGAQTNAVSVQQDQK